MRSPISIAVKANNDAIFSCSAKGYGDIKITWKKLNSTLPSSALSEEIKSIKDSNITSILTISKVVGYYEGYYYCEMSNSAGKVYSKEAFLNVSGK